VVARLKEIVLASARLFADETVVPVLDPGLTHEALLILTRQFWFSDEQIHSRDKGKSNIFSPLS